MKKIKKILFGEDIFPNNSVWIISVGAILITFFVLLSKSCDDKKETKPQFDYQTFEDGKSIGRNAMIIYLNQTLKNDTLKIDLCDLLKIEDSLSATIAK